MRTHRLVWRDLYRNRLLVTGITLLCLGMGNWMVGSRKLAHYRGVLATAAGSSQPSLRFGNEGLWQSAREVDERTLVARNKMDLYHVVASGGRLMITIGLLSLVAAFISRRHRAG